MTTSLGSANLDAEDWNAPYRFFALSVLGFACHVRPCDFSYDFRTSYAPGGGMSWKHEQQEFVIKLMCTSLTCYGDVFNLSISDSDKR